MATDAGLALGAQRTTLQTLPVELLAEIFSELDLESLVKVSCLSRRLRAVTADSSLNPWRRPILHNLHRGVYEKSLSHLSIHSIVPRQNWIEILTFASPSFLLFESSIPNLRSSEWEECFRRRYLPGWAKWKKDTPWREAFMKVLYRVWHRCRSSCTSDESWTKYIVINRNGSVNELEVASRSFSPLGIFHEMKLQNNLAHLPTQIRVVLELADVRMIVLGMLDRPRTHLRVNRNARAFLCPPGLGSPNSFDSGNGAEDLISHANESNSRASVGPCFRPHHDRLSYPMPSPAYHNYPMYTPGGSDQRWHPDAMDDDDMEWVGGMMVTAQLYGSDPQGLNTHPPHALGLFGGLVNKQFASFTWHDFLTVAPWMEERVTKCIYGQGLGIS